VQPWAEEGIALLEKAAGQGHAYAMHALGCVHEARKEYEQAVHWVTMGAEAGFPKALYNLGHFLDEGKGMAAPDHLAAAGWYKYGLADIARHVIQRALNPRLVH